MKSILEIVWIFHLLVQTIHTWHVSQSWRHNFLTCLKIFQATEVRLNAFVKNTSIVRTVQDYFNKNSRQTAKETRNCLAKCQQNLHNLQIRPKNKRSWFANSSGDIFLLHPQVPWQAILSSVCHENQVWFLSNQLEPAHQVASVITGLLGMQGTAPLAWMGEYFCERNVRALWENTITVPLRILFCL